jgi:hypothetical protein
MDMDRLKTIQRCVGWRVWAVCAMIAACNVVMPLAQASATVNCDERAAPSVGQPSCHETAASPSAARDDCGSRMVKGACCCDEHAPSGTPERRPAVPAAQTDVRVFVMAPVRLLDSELTLASSCVGPTVSSAELARHSRLFLSHRALLI